MEYFKLRVFCILKKNIKYRDLFSEISDAINKTMLGHEDLKKMHKLNKFKMYSFSGFNPIEKEGYKADSMYYFDIKTIDESFALIMKDLLTTDDNDLFDVVDVVNLKLEIGNIKSLYTTTPAISVINIGDHWDKKNHTMELLIKNINNNAMKKFQAWFKEPIDSTNNFIDDIEQLNNKAIVFPYKKGILIGNKFRLSIKQDITSQNLAKMVFVVGLLEKNALGFGYLDLGKEGN